jgi:hypothetical protein
MLEFRDHVLVNSSVILNMDNMTGLTYWSTQATPKDIEDLVTIGKGVSFLLAVSLALERVLRPSNVSVFWLSACHSAGTSM